MLFIKQSIVPSTVFEKILQAPEIHACLKHGAGPCFLRGKCLTTPDLLQIAEVYSVHN
ncbi:MAG TPA: hypothetical protein VE566_02625 [Nitrososphaeraceae archaeon]|nr:hypothetical protein [Nitrososphaeraceae archaeon]